MCWGRFVTLISCQRQVHIRAVNSPLLVSDIALHKKFKLHIFNSLQNLHSLSQLMRTDFIYFRIVFDNRSFYKK